MPSFIRLLLFVILLLPVNNCLAIPPVEELMTIEKVTVKKADRKRKKGKRVIMSNKIIEYRKTFYIT